MVEVTLNSNNTIKNWASMIKIEHTVFALPFCLSGFFLGAKNDIDITKLCLAVLAFTFARTASMCLNRVIDAKIDAQNPRTQMREIPQGIIKPANAIIAAVLSFCLMLILAYNINSICFYLSPIALFWLSFYSYTKRFTYLCHYVLGISLGGAAMGGYLAACGSFNSWILLFLPLAVMFWVAGFDILYALADYDFDIKNKIQSIPAKFGIDLALRFAKLSHVFAVVCLGIIGIFLKTSNIYYSGLTVIALLLIYEHILLRDNSLSKLNQAFFNVNGIISIFYLVIVLLNKYV